MAFKKGANKTQGAQPKGKPPGKKGPAQKLPVASRKDEEEDDDLDEGSDLEFGDESDMSGLDEDLDDEELEDEELEDEEVDDEELEEGESDEEEEDEVAKPAGKQQQTPKKQQEQPKKATPLLSNGKRKAEGDAGFPSKKIKLEDHLPATFVVNYRSRDVCDVKLTDLAAGTTVDDIKTVCKGCSEVKGKGPDTSLLYAFVSFPAADKAVAAFKMLKSTKLNGKLVTATYMGDKWNSEEDSPIVLDDTLDIRNIPSNTDRKAFGALFPSAKVLKFFHDGYAQLKFKSSDELTRALKNPKCRTVGGKNLMFALAIRNKPGQKKAVVKKDASPKKGPKSPQSPAKTPKLQEKQAKGKTPKGSPKSPKQHGGKETPESPLQAPKGLQTPKASPKQTPKATPKQTPKATPKQTPKATPKQTPKVTQGKTPKKTPGKKAKA